MRADVKLDRIDINILAHLQRNGRISNIELAELVGLSPSACLQRVKRLEKAGFIEGYRTQIGFAKLLEHVSVFTEVTLSDHRREDFIKFESRIRRFDSVQECHLISGGYDYLLKFVCLSIADYHGDHS
jgi:DNA-binding Lrp family transcriptional regulator